MPKKSSARVAAQRNKAKVQKSFELVRPLNDEDTLEQQTSNEEITAVAVAESEPEPQQPQERKKEKAVSSASRVEAPSTPSAPAPAAVPETPKGGSAATQLAARRQATQRAKQRSAAALITPEHFAYVRKDLVTIAVLATLMFAAIVFLYFFFGSVL